MARSDSIHLEAILLAAGRSRRMGGVNKLLLPVDGVAMVRRTALLYCALGMRLTVVTGPDASAVADALGGLEVRLVVNPDADEGQETSVLAGLLATPLDTPGVVVALADQPLLTTADIGALVAEFVAQGAGRICVPRFAGKRGNPVIFPAEIGRRLRAPGALSPRGFVDAHPGEVCWFEAGNEHFTRDVDTPAEAAELIGVAVAAHRHD